MSRHHDPATLCLTKRYEQKAEKGFLLAVVLLVLLAAVSGCGKRPGSVDAPSGASGAFPQVYPDPSTDPKP